VEYKKFLGKVCEETEDPEWAIANHPAKKILERFDPEFGTWVNWLQKALLMQAGGYPFGKNDLSITEWQALAILKQFNEKNNHV